MMPVLMETAARLHALPAYRNHLFLIAAAPGRTREDYDLRGNGAFVRVVSGDTYAVLRQSEAALINSGTASLEAALIGTPQAVGYRMAPLSALIVRLIIKVRYVSLANLILDRAAFREFLQEDLTPDHLAAELRRLLEDGEYRAKMQDDYAEVREKLGGAGASAAVAQAMVEALKQA